MARWTKSKKRKPGEMEQGKWPFEGQNELEKRQNTDCGVMEMAKQGTKCRSRYRFF
jgi:hypothetical protein